MVRWPLLHAEDDSDDALLIHLALQKARGRWEVHHVQDGQAATDYLKGISRYRDRELHPLPSFVLLDLKLPLLNGFEVLSWIRAEPSFSTVPAVILSGSSLDEDRAKARRLGANGFFAKTPHYRDLVQFIDRWAAQAASSLEAFADEPDGVTSRCAG